MFAGSPILSSTIRRFRGRLLLNGVVLLAQALILLALPLPLKFALDRIVSAPSGEQAIRLLAVATISLLALGALSSLLEYVEERLNIRLVNDVVTRARADLWDQMMSRRQSFLDGWRKVDVAGRLMGDIQNLEVFVVSGNVVVMRAIPSLILVIGAMFVISPVFAALIVGVMPLFYLLIQTLSKRIRAADVRARRAQNALDQDLLQTLNSLALIKSLIGERDALASLAHRQQALNLTAVDSRHQVALFNSAFSGSRHLLRAVVVFLGGWAVLSGNLSLGTLFAFVTYLESMNRPIAEISNFISRYGKAHASLARVEEFRAALEPQAEIGGPLKVPDNWSRLRFENVALRHGTSPALFHDLSLELTRGQLVALVGASGVGKTSLIRLLNRLRDADQGGLFLDDSPLDSFTLESLRRNVCVISQEPFFLAASIRENLLLALDPTTPDAAIWDALKAVNADAFVAAFPQGLESLIGESGLAISGGQGKRLSLARAFLRRDRARLFVFDEPTSGLDPHSAALVMESLRELSRNGALVLFSTHRVEEFRTADTVLFFSAHRDPILATHAELELKDDAYRGLIRTEAQA